MGGITTRRWTDGQTVWFAVSGIGAELMPVAPHLLMDYERHGDEWRHGYPADTPHVEQAWENFSRYIELILRQVAKLEPVPWRAALRELCHRTAGQRVAWWLTGSAALAVRGAPIEPGDLDLVCGVQDAARLGDLFSDAIIEPALPASSDWISEWWGRAFCGARIEWIGGPKSWVDQPQPCDFGPVAASRLDTVSFEDWSIQVPPLDLQRSVNQRRGLTSRITMIDALTA